MSDFDIHEVAARIKALYTSYVRAHPSGMNKTYVPNARWSDVWTKAASQCLEHDLNPEALVRSVLDARLDSKVYPTHLLGVVAIDSAKEFAEREADREFASIQSQLSLLEAYAQRGEDVSVLLSNEFEDLNPSLRYAFAVKAGLRDVADRFKDAARLELRFNSIRLKIMSSLLSADFLAEVMGDE